MNDNFLDITNNKPLLGKATYDVMLWIDSDIEWKPEDFLKLYNSDKDITTGIYISDQGVLMYTPSSKEHLAKTEHIEITHAGFGFIAIKKGVFENVSRPWFQTQYTKQTIDGKEYLIPFGEDYSFCTKARQAGFKIYVDPTIRVTHHKNVPLRVKL
jgi:GT2 family glycosyltransferase